MVNDYFDQIADKTAGKENTISTLTTWQQKLAIFVAFIFGLIAFIPFYQYRIAIIWLILSYLFAVLYSATPFRLKEKAIWGLACSSLAQRVFPLLIVYSVFQHFGFDAILFVGLSFLIGLRWILIHQILDLEKDLQANVQTFASSASFEKTCEIIRFITAVETALLSLFLGVVTYMTSYLLILGFCYVIYEVYLFPLWRKLGIKRILYSYEFAPLADFYFLWLPLGTSIMLALINQIFFPIVVLEILWKINYLKLDVGLIKLRRKQL
jgi:4-hydroxybenzoate polyprenyltransferase